MLGLPEAQIKLVVVTHNTGIREPNLQTFDQEIKRRLRIWVEGFTPEQWF